MTEDNLALLMKILMGDEAKLDETVVAPTGAVGKTEKPVVVERPKRCQHTECTKKLALSDMPCKCEKIFCQAHRYAELHTCTFDFKDESRKRLEKQLVKTVGQKVEPI
jgi:hypothetical protein